ncbi:MFS transporter [Escherichia coli]
MNQQASWRTIVGYSLGDVANNFAFANALFHPVTTPTSLAVGAAAAGTMLLLVRVFDAFADVFAGPVVDSVNTRWENSARFYSLVLRRGHSSVLVFWVPTDWSHSSKMYAYLPTWASGFATAW